MAKQVRLPRSQNPTQHEASELGEKYPNEATIESVESKVSENNPYKGLNTSDYVKRHLICMIYMEALMEALELPENATPGDLITKWYYLNEFMRSSI